jgi:beta-lactam-binding protein with PASTA domain
MKKINFDKIKTNFRDQISNLQNGGKPLIFTIIATFVVMVVVCLAVFFASVKGSEEVMVPNVVGKDWQTALLEMQAKELYSKIQLKYSDVPDDDGTVLDQSPDAGSIVKAYRTVVLTISRGAIANQVGDYIGQNYDDMKVKIQTQFTGQKQLIVFAEPVYKADSADVGTILEQEPPAGTQINDPVTVHVIVSSGQNFEKTKVPNIVGKNVDDVLKVMGNNKIVFDFTSHVAGSSEKAGTVVSEQSFTDDYVTNYQRVQADFAFPDKAKDNLVYGLFTKDLADYPYAVAMRIDATDSEGQTTTLLNFTHPGKNLTVPYAVPAGTVLTLYVVGKDMGHIKVE